MKKIAISLPDHQADAIEKIRRKARIPRSRVIQQAIALYLAEGRHAQKVRAYEDAYTQKPEREEADAQAFARATAAVLSDEDWS